MFGGFGGSFFATRQGFISPESFTFIESAIILAIVVLGGMGSQIGVVFAAILLIGHVATQALKGMHLDDEADGKKGKSKGPTRANVDEDGDLI